MNALSHGIDRLGSVRERPHELTAACGLHTVMGEMCRSFCWIVRATEGGGKSGSKPDSRLPADIDGCRIRAGLSAGRDDGSTVLLYY